MKNILLIIVLIWTWNINAQKIEMLWHSDPGELPIGSLVDIVKPQASTALMDINNDGVKDFAIARNGLLTVRDGVTHNKIYQGPLPQGIENLHYESLFIQVDSTTSQKEIVMGDLRNNRLIGMLEGGKVKYNNGLIFFSKDYILIGTANFELDGKGSDLMFGNMKEQRIEIWGVTN